MSPTTTSPSTGEWTPTPWWSRWNGRDLSGIEAEIDDELRRGPAFRTALAAARWCLLAGHLKGAGRFAEAAAAYEEAVGIDPRDPDLWAAYGATLADAGRGPASARAFRRALSLRPEDGLLQHAFGASLLRQGLHDEALSPLLDAVRLSPNDAAANRNLAVALRALGRLEDAESFDRRAVALAPGDVDALWNLGVGLLMAGQWAEGWACYEARLLRPDSGRPALPDVPDWDGTPDPSLDLVVYAEQGLGDSIQFARYLPAARSRVRSLTFLGPAVLRPLFTGQGGIDHFVHRAVDAQGGARVALLSLPTRLSLQDPAHAPPATLTADPLLREQWRREVRSLGPFVVGLAFQGNPLYPADRQRSVPLTALTDLLAHPELTILSLQKQHGLEQVDALPHHLRPHLWTDRLDRDSGPFRDTAAILQSVDAFVTSDSAVAHLAGCLGVRTHLLLPAVPDWRWGLTGSHHPHYPSLTLHRQRRRGDWSDPVRSTLAALEDQRRSGAT